MNLERKSLAFVFVITLLAFFLFPLFFSKWPILYFVPFLIIGIYQKSLLNSLWMAFFCGLFLDLISAHTRVGMQAAAYCFATAIIYKQKQSFFADSLSTLPLMTFFFSILTTVFQLLFIYMIGEKFLITKYWILTDLIYMPGVDAAYAFTLFILPAVCFGKRPRRAKEYFLDRKKG